MTFLFRPNTMRAQSGNFSLIRYLAVFFFFSQVGVEPALAQDTPPPVLAPAAPAEIATHGSMALAIEPMVIRGFPAFVTVNAIGYLIVSKLTPVQPEGEIEIDFREGVTGAKFSVISYPNSASHGIGRDSHGTTFDSSRFHKLSEDVVLWSPGDKASMLFDMSALRLGTWESSGYAAIPTGHYNIAFGTTRHPIFSAPVPLEIAEPNLAEKSYLLELQNSWSAKYQELMAEPRSYRPYGPLPRFDWRWSLSDPFPLPDPRGLRPVAREHVAVYELLAAIVSTPDTLQRFPLEKLEAPALPVWFSPLKEVIRYELLSARDPIVATTQRSTVLQKYPGWEWALVDVDEKNGLVAKLVKHRWKHPGLNATNPKK